MSKQPPPASTARAVGPCPTLIQISRTYPALEVYPAPSHHPTTPLYHILIQMGNVLLYSSIGSLSETLTASRFDHIFLCDLFISDGQTEGGLTSIQPEARSMLYHLYFTFKLSIYVLNFSMEFFPLAIAVQNTQRHRPQPHPQTTLTGTFYYSSILGGGRVVRWCWVNFQCRGVLQV